MYFKRIELVGFKSFMNKTKLKFEPGVTAVVGPNGCGKSNIVDAIKWVLGEQSVKSMRSSSMQDVIFNGTDKHDPLNMAEVSLVLSNEDGALPVDYDEVIITRRLFRSGDSEYLLNKMPVRLTDIKNMIMGTGIGTSSYSVIEQGRLDMILSSRPEERRYIFEEASGITRYKAKKREAMLKLQHTQENLVRINDIIREVERQINSIERQARKAERYRMRYEELKDLEVKLSYLKYKELSKEDNLLGDQNEDLRKRCEELKKELDGSTSMLSSQRAEYNKIMENLQVSQNEIMQLGADIDKNKHTIGVNKERKQELEKHVQKVDREVENITERKDALGNRLAALEARLNDVTRKREAKDRELASFEHKVRTVAEQVENHRHQLILNREKTVDLVSEETRTKNTLIKMNADLQNMIAREKRIKAEQNNVEAEKGNVAEKLKETEETAARLKTELDAKKEEVRNFNESYSGKQKACAELNDERVKKEKRLHEIMPRREFLEKLIAEREGINESVKEIMKHVEMGDSRFSGVHGILSELINIKEGFEESMEFILGDIAQAVVVDSRRAADSVIEFLQQNSMTSINFVILEELSKLNTSRAGASMKIDSLDDITHVLAAGEPYCSALRTMLNDTFVAASSGTARSFVEDDGFNGRIVGERGEVFQKGAHRSKNYSGKEVISLFGRQEKVMQLMEEESIIKGELSETQNRIVEIEEWLEEAARRKECLESELREKQSEFADASNKKYAIEEKVRSLEEELQLLNTELEEEADAIRRLKEEGDNLNRRLNELEEENTRLQCMIEESQQVIQDGAREREEALYAITDVKAELSALRKEEENLIDNLTREKEVFQRVDNEVEEKRRNVTESGERIRALDDEVKELLERNLEFIARKEIRSFENKEKFAEKVQLSRVTGELEEKTRRLEEDLENSRNQLRDMDLNKKDYEYKRTSLADRIRDSYKVDLKELTLEVEGSFDREEAEGKIAELKEQLEKMGNVSLGAVEEHKQLQERFEFLTKQRDDLNNAKESLMKAIAKINRTTRKLFMESFEAIRKEFTNYFRMLFNGGKAELILEDEHNILECGIDIVVRPPGKKLQNIMLLSGGEKALTAIALMFAIFKVNPSPFCILDEIDAPLDESNVVRFSRVLQEFLKLSQFIIVTHNRMTIQLADILYGITMEEKGVSKVVSVKFTEEKELKDSVEIGV